MLNDFSTAFLSHSATLTLLWLHDLNSSLYYWSWLLSATTYLVLLWNILITCYTCFYNVLTTCFYNALTTCFTMLWLYITCCIYKFAFKFCIDTVYNYLLYSRNLKYTIIENKYCITYTYKWKLFLNHYKIIWTYTIT